MKAAIYAPVEQTHASEEIEAYEGVAAQLRAKLAAKGRTREIARQFADYCRKLDGAFETVSIPFERKREMLTVLRVNVLAHETGSDDLLL